ncbi:hypothetical protein F5141DRAFT_1135905, partial [Pisolithus sp. B1]
PFPQIWTSWVVMGQWLTALGGSILVFEYMYFSLQVNPDEQNVEKHFRMAVKEYQTSGVQAKVTALIVVAFQEHGENVEVLCPILVNIAKENQMSKKLLG